MSDQDPPPPPPHRTASLSRGFKASTSRSRTPIPPIPPVPRPTPRPNPTPPPPRPIITQSRGNQTRRSDDEQQNFPEPILPNDQIQKLFYENQSLKRQLKHTKQFSPNRVTDNSMSYRYLHIDSAHLEHLQDKQFEYKVNLLEPIRNASHIELTAFSVANDFFNVVEDHNEFRMLFKRKPSVGTTALNDVYMLSTLIDPGFYTHAELLSAIVAQINLASNGFNAQAEDNDGFIEFYPKVLATGASTFSAQTTYGLKIKFTAETSGRTLIEMKGASTPVADPISYAMLAYPYEDLQQQYKDSILHRLGFTKYQVYFTEKNITVSQSVFLEITGAVNSINLVYQKNIYQALPTSYAISNSSLRPFTREFTNSSYQELRSNKLAWETHSSLILTCDLIHDIQTTTPQYLTLGRTEFSDAIAHVKIDVNRASWVHYVPQQYTHLHKVTQPVIQIFRIALKNPHNHRHFRADEHRAFQVEFKIYTMDDESIPNQQFFSSIAEGMRNFSYKD